MVSAANNHVDDSLFFALMVCVLGYAGYLWVLRSNLLAQIGTIALGVLTGVFGLILAGLCLAGAMDEHYVTWRNRCLHLAAGLVLGAFIYRSVRLPLVWSDWTFLAHAGVAFLIIAYYSVIICRKIFGLVARSRLRKEQIITEQARIRQILQCNLDKASLEDASNLLIEMTPGSFLRESLTPYLEEYQLKRIQIRNRLDVLNNEAEQRQLRQEQRALEQQRQEIKVQEPVTIEDQNQEIKNKIEDDNKPVYLVKNLNKNIIRILRSLNYKKTSEYDLLEQKNIDVLVKPIMNHSTTHTFLVWSTKRLLERDFAEIENLQEHETRDADITFQHHRKKYAIEIETGNLLKKKKQLLAKIAYLNKKYTNRWFFIVSNKNLQSAYRKHGSSTPRKWVVKTLAKLLKSSTPQKGGVT